MKKLLTLIAVVGSLNVCWAQTFTAALSGTQEVPPNNSTSLDGTYGLADFSLSGTTFTVTSGFYGYSIPATEIAVSDAPTGFNALAPLFDLTIDPDAFPVGGGLVDGTFSGSGTLTSAEITDLDAGDLYVNIESAVYPAGEIRGQIEGAVPPGSSSVPDSSLTLGLLFISGTALVIARKKFSAA